MEKQWKKLCPVALTVDDPIWSLSDVKADDEKKKMMKDVVEKKDQIQFVDVSKKRLSGCQRQRRAQGL